jgi:hypothetical protein
VWWIPWDWRRSNIGLLEIANRMAKAMIVEVPVFLVVNDGGSL